MSKGIIKSTFVAAAALALCACGGGGSGGTQVASTPTPPPAPPPPAPPPTQPPVKIFANPTPVEYATVGASIAGLGGNLDKYDSANATFGPISTADADQAHIRYNAGGYYEIEMPGESWDRLIHYKGTVDPSAEDNYFQPQNVAQNLAFIVTANSRDKGYNFSELGSWGSSASARWGYEAFGVPTPEGAVPVSGAASYSGLVYGSADILVADNLYGGYFPLGIN